MILRVESFIEHQDSCTVRTVRPELQALQPSTAAAAAATACSSRTASSTSPSSDANFGSIATPILPAGVLNLPKPMEPMFLISERKSAKPSSTTTANTNNSNSTHNHHHHHHHHRQQHFLELQLLPSSSPLHNSPDDNFSTRLKLSIGSSPCDEKTELAQNNNNKPSSEELVKLAMAEKAYAEEARREAKRQIEIAEMEFANAKRIRQQAQAELEKAQLLREQATKRISSTILQITCQACKQQFQTTPSAAAAVQVGGPSDETTSLAMSYMSSATTEGEGE